MATGKFDPHRRSKTFQHLSLDGQAGTTLKRNMNRRTAARYSKLSPDGHAGRKTRKTMSSGTQAAVLGGIAGAALAHRQFKKRHGAAATARSGSGKRQRRDRKGRFA